MKVLARSEAGLKARPSGVRPNTFQQPAWKSSLSANSAWRGSRALVGWPKQPEPSPAQAPLKLQLVPDINTNFHFRSQPNSLAQYTHRGIPAHFFLWLGPVSATRFAFLTTPVFLFWLSLYYARLHRPNRRARHPMFMSSIRPKGARLSPSFV